MKKPLIGVIPLWDEHKHSLWMLPGYMDGIALAGGIPVMLPLTTDGGVIEQLAQTFDGFLFTGGQDISPKLYNHEKLPLCGESFDKRDAMDALLFAQILALDKPALGICRGLQIFNVLLGGTLYQDIATQYEGSGICTHFKAPPHDRAKHGISIQPGSPIHQVLQMDRLVGVSYHHQAIHKLSPRLISMATADDGLIEAAYMPDQSFVWALQWHPEYALPEQSSRRLFGAFVNACQ